MNRRRLMPQPDPDGAIGGNSKRHADIELFARTLWGESAGESIRGIEAVAAAVMNRATALAGGSIDEACRSFPCWNAGNPDRSRLLGLKPGSGSAGELLFTTCLRIAR
ncbi:MAG TPA: hypothetical protein VEX87_16110, partial [Skermanella sp.]|nr:hypothetical protein [Skermanella sp.]